MVHVFAAVFLCSSASGRATTLHAFHTLSYISGEFCSAQANSFQRFLVRSVVHRPTHSRRFVVSSVVQRPTDFRRILVRTLVHWLTDFKMLLVGAVDHRPRAFRRFL
jgi:hypothetical protein